MENLKGKYAARWVEKGRLFATSGINTLGYYVRNGFNSKLVALFKTSFDERYLQSRLMRYS